MKSVLALTILFANDICEAAIAKVLRRKDSQDSDKKDWDIYHSEGPANNIFKPIGSDPPSEKIPLLGAHPCQPKSIKQNPSLPIHTNKFYSNFFLGDQQNMSWTNPYGVWWDKAMHALGISHAEPDDYEWGPPTPGLAAEYNYTKSSYASPLRRMALGFSAVEFDDSTSLELDGLGMFTINVSLVHDRGSLTMPLTQGQGFNTAVYKNVSPKIVTQLQIKYVVVLDYEHKNLTKYKVGFHDNTTWLIFTIPNPGSKHYHFDRYESNLIAAKVPFDGVIQISKIPREDFPRADRIYTCLAGKYVVGASISGAVGDAGDIYSIRFRVAGTSLTGLLMYAYHHHTASWGDAEIKEDIQMMSTTKGMMQGYNHEHLTLFEDVSPWNVDWLPWRSPEVSALLKNRTSLYSLATIQTIAAAARDELSMGLRRLNEMDSIYSAGKAFHKLAQICLVVNDILHDNGLTTWCERSLKWAMNDFIESKQQGPFLYDSTYKGIVTKRVRNFNIGPPQEQASSLYYVNHFHEYGYLIGAAAVLAHLHPPWALENKGWVDMLVRDIANPSADDPHFPQMRSFDFFQGHSTVNGLVESANGRAWTSVSEDIHCAHAIKLWGLVTNNDNMKNVGNLMSAVIMRTAKRYMFMGSKTGIVPKEYRMNIVAGVLYENKADHRKLWQSDHPLLSAAAMTVAHIRPISQLTPYLRHQEFVREEYDVLFQQQTDGFNCDGCRGLYYSNLAVIDPQKSYRFFIDPTNKRFLDDT